MWAPEQGWGVWSNESTYYSYGDNNNHVTLENKPFQRYAAARI